MSITLYQLGEEYQQALDAIEIDEETGEVIGFEKIEALEAQYDQKAINCALYLKSLDAEVKAIKAEETALKQRRETAQKKLDRLKRYIELCMRSAGKDIIQDPRVRLSFRRSKKVQILNESLLPARLLRIKTEPNRVDIAHELKAGKDVPGAAVVNNLSLQIK